MDFKSLISKLDSMEAPPKTPAAPIIDKAVQLNEDAQLRVLAGQTSYITEAAKKKDEDKKKADKEDVKEEMKVGDKKASSTGGTIEKTATGVKHTAGKNYSGKAAEADKKKTDESKMMPKGKKKPVKESVESKLTFKEMIMLVQESGGQQQIDAVDQELFAWAQRVAGNKFQEGTKAEVYAGLVYERMGGRFEMYDVLSEDQQ